jgi:phospholipid transport system substrate-binding protein
MRKVTPVLVALGLSLAAPVLACAQASDPAAQQVDSFDKTLLATMKAGKSLGAEGRYKKLEPTVTSDFDLAAMIRVAVGPAAWAKMSSSDQAALKAAFARFTVANYAHNFSDFSGQKFVTGAVTTRLPDKLVSTQIVNPTGSAIPLAYRMRNNGGGWKIIDVFYNGSISSLAQQSSDFSGALARGGAPALIKKLNDQSEKLLQGG